MLLMRDMEKTESGLSDKAPEITLSNDFAFKKVFGSPEHIDIAIDFVSTITGLSKNELANMQIVNTEISPRFAGEKSGRQDIKFLLQSGEKLSLEMQNVFFNQYPVRTIFYVAHEFIKNFHIGSLYEELKKCIIISVVNSSFKPSSKFHSIYKIMEVGEHTILDDKMELHFLDLTKINQQNMSQAEKWGLFIQTTSNDVRARLAKENPYMEKANQVLNTIFLSPEEREAYMQALFATSDRVSMFEDGRKEGLEEGIEQGWQEGKQEGSYETKMQTARNMLRLKLPIEIIMEATGLKKSEITKLKE